MAVTLNLSDGEAHELSGLLYGAAETERTDKHGDDDRADTYERIARKINDAKKR